MYLKGARLGHYDSSGQHTARGEFLILLDNDPTAGLVSRPELRWIVRKVALRQIGHFMMGKANIGGQWFIVSGPFGNDGLPMHFDFMQRYSPKLSASIWDDAPTLPQNLTDAYWSSTSADGSESRANTAIRQYVIDVRR